jgi:hypothetical protein
LSGQKDRPPLWLREVNDPRKSTEKPIYEMVVSLYRNVGLTVIRHSQPHKASQTKGIWDIECYYRKQVAPGPVVPGAGHIHSDREGQLWHVVHWGHEVKRYSARNHASASQVQFHRQLAVYGVLSIVGGVNTAIIFLERYGIAKLDLLPNHW